MKLLKKGLFLAVIIIAVFFCVNAYAQGDALNTVKIYFSGNTTPTIIEGDAVMQLYSEDGTTLLDTKTYAVKRGYAPFEIVFNVPEYSIGTKFKFVISGIVEATHHNGFYANEHILETYAMPDENGVDKCYTSFYMDLCTKWNKEAIIKIPGVEQTLFYHCLTDDEVYVTTDLLHKLGIQTKNYFDEEKPYVKLYTDDGHSAQLYLNDVYALFGYEGVNLSIPTFRIDTMVYVPLSRVAQYFACNYNMVEDNTFYREITLTPSEYSPNYRRIISVNKKDISSKTNYMIWVSKKDFEVNIFTGSKNNWSLVKSFTCSIGKPSSPTVEGQFEYHQYQPIWKYDKYYCGPVMRFYRGYAFHSYLIKYDGTPYDSRLGMKVSAGCVRMHPDDIKWMVKNIPLYTKVVVTP